MNYWEKWTGQEAAAMQEVVDLFNASQDRIYVRFLPMTMIEQKAMVAIAGGNPPDIVGLYNKSIPLFAESGAITPLDGLADDVGIRKGDYAGAIWKLLRHEVGASERLYGLPNTCSTMALYYRPDILRDAGLNAPPRTISELDEYAKRLEVFGANGAMKRAGFIQTEPGWWPQVWGHQFGGSLFDVATQRAGTADDANVRAYEWVQSYPERLGVERVRGFQSGMGSYMSVEQPLLDGKVAMCMHGPFLVNVIQRFKPDLEYNAAPFPVVDGLYDADAPVGLLECDVLTIPTGCPHPREAMEFIAFTQKPEMTERLAIAHGKPTPLSQSSETYYAKHPNRAIRVHEQIARSDRAFGYPRTRVWNEYEAEFRQAFEGLWRLERPAREVLAAIAARVQPAIDQSNARTRARAEGRA